MKLTKAQLKSQKELQDLINSKDKFTEEETERIYNDFNEGFLGDVSHNSAYFTPLELALDFQLMCVAKHGTILDLCAGFGVLSYAAMQRDYYEGNIKKIICLERDQRYIDIGKKLVQTNKNTEVVWIKGDMFDQNLWENIIKEHGEINSIYSNPPFGSVSQTDYNRDWLKYKGKDIDMASIEIAIKYSKQQAFILPQGSCTFRASGRPYPDHVENRKVTKLKKEIGMEFNMSWGSIDSKSGYYGQFKNTHVCVECLSLDDVRDNEGNEIFISSKDSVDKNTTATVHTSNESPSKSNHLSSGSIISPGGTGMLDIGCCIT